MSKNILDNHVLKFPLKKTIVTSSASVYEIDGIVTSLTTKNNIIGESLFMC